MFCINNIPCLLPNKTLNQFFDSWFEENLRDNIRFSYTDFPGNSRIADKYPAYIAPPDWPAPPKLKLNELYVPSGATRFSMCHVMMKHEDMVDAFSDGLSISPGGYNFAPDQDAHNEIELSVTQNIGLDGNPKNPFTLTMYALTPILVNATWNWDEKIYIVPLVDQRYFWQTHKVGFFGFKEKYGDEVTWKNLNETASKVLKESFGVPGANVDLFGPADPALLFPHLGVFEKYMSVGLWIEGMLMGSLRKMTYDAANETQPITTWSKQGSAQDTLITRAVNLEAVIAGEHKYAAYSLSKALYMSWRPHAIDGHTFAEGEKTVARNSFLGQIGSTARVDIATSAASQIDRGSSGLQEDSAVRDKLDELDDIYILHGANRYQYDFTLPGFYRIKPCSTDDYILYSCNDLECPQTRVKSLPSDWYYPFNFSCAYSATGEPANRISFQRRGQSINNTVKISTEYGGAKGNYRNADSGMFVYGPDGDNVWTSTIPGTAEYNHNRQGLQYTNFWNKTFLTPGDGIPAAVDGEAGIADCVMYERVGSSQNLSPTSETHPVRNISDTDIAGDTLIVVMPIDGLLYAITSEAGANLEIFFIPDDEQQYEANISRTSDPVKLYAGQIFHGYRMVKNDLGWNQWDKDPEPLILYHISEGEIELDRMYYVTQIDGYRFIIGTASNDSDTLAHFARPHSYPLRIPRATLQQNTLKPGSAFCYRYEWDPIAREFNLQLGNAVRVFNSMPSDVDAEVFIAAKNKDGDWFVIVEPCGSLYQGTGFTSGLGESAFSDGGTAIDQGFDSGFGGV